MLSAMKRSLSVESFAEPEGSGGSGFSISKRLRTGVRRHVFDKDAQMHTKYVMQDKVERPQFVKKIALSYIVSAALIAVLCLTGQIIVQVYESRTHTDGRYVNTAGKQRYFSQAIVKASLAMERANGSGDPASSAHFQSQLQYSLQQWYTAQYGLQFGDGSLQLSGSKDKTVRRLFAQVEPNFQMMYAAGTKILQDVSGTSFDALGVVPPETPSNALGISANVDVLTANEETFLRLMNEIVGRFQDLGEEHVRTLLIITWIFAALIILTLILEGVFLVRPVLMRMHLLVSERFDLLHASLEAEAGARGVSILMVGYVSHEMREPLGSVMRNLKYLFGQLKQMAIIHGKPEGGALHEACKSAMETLRQSLNSCRLLATVIDDIADMRKLEAGMLTLYTKPVDISECMRHVAGMMQPKLGVTLRSEMDPSVEGKRYNLDRHRLEQLLVNLISNAMKFTREGTVVVRVLPWDDRGLRFEVIDHGIGMTSEASAKVFMPFIETPHDKANFQGGTGLGLYICKLLADLMGGTIGVTSEVGHGSTFWFNVPASVLVDHALSSANSNPRDPPVINGFTTSGALPEGREGEIDEDEKDEDERELPPLMESQQDVETTVSGPGHVHHGGVSITSILGSASKPFDELDHISPHSRRGGSLRAGSKFWSLSESSPRRGGSYHGGNSYRGEGSYRGGARRGSSVHGGSVYRGGGPGHLTIDIEGLSQRGSRGAPSPLGNGGGLVRTSSNTNTPLLATQGPTFVYHGRPVGPPRTEVKSLDVETGDGGTRGVRVGRESARGGNLFLKLQEKMQAGGGDEKEAPRDASDSV